MLILGVSGGPVEVDGCIYPVGYHDSAACLLDDGKLVSAVEEERLNRIKKGFAFPMGSIQACLDQAGAELSDLDAIAMNFAEDFVDRGLVQDRFVQGGDGELGARAIVRRLLRESFGSELPDEKLIFVRHHVAHGLSAFANSGMTEALVAVMDGSGEAESGTLFRGAAGHLEPLKTFPLIDSLGFLYLAVTKFLGYGFGDEYKVMGLAPYGDPKKCRDIVQSLYTLTGEGDYELYGRSDDRYFALGLEDLPYTYVARACASAGLLPRRKGEQFTEQHADLAAALQEAVETIAAHVFEHWTRVTGLRRLCFSGGVAHNCTLNGVLVRSGMFDEVFVHPASHDAGAAEGAALAAYSSRSGDLRTRQKLRSASFGPALGSAEQIARELKSWSELISYEQVDDPVVAAAELLSAGAVLGWAQGRSEFGPRALGNRSILADPRPAANRSRVNQLIKSREDFRPFAPVVIPEAAGDYFELPAAEANYDFMSYVLPVRPERRDELGAVTHVDGSARVQIIAAESDERFYRLVKRFGELTGTPVLLNTSFNNNAEPIVQSVEDVLTCYLTTGLDYVVLENFLIRRQDKFPKFDNYRVRLRPRASIVERVDNFGAAPEISHRLQLAGIRWEVGARGRDISPRLFGGLTRSGGEFSMAELAADGELTAADREEIYALWRERFLTLTPGTD
ncbi:carbamoyltransferase family protein [Kribbella solani]|uniref:carbamoyltransferase family protein n=1 Tax=Kribbella solani TaxID=236067 RepID=UPI0029A112FB|nr:carbamoyltransferase C-terminal domain-containing protein [Kribbella solani]MDX2970614.1 carbamoyltransferase C-terminal domain-containing protein [Kribbella solani]